ncbi:hypothetical protein CUR178_05301 [Leishmania enriettii]|uniref:Proteasome assembly chaperone 3 n=1 Tax=Leishmania enriettii TaxID=5663 RepID=A0A836HGT3_LEIEN|nr:hypothetical protein CUR178_05301 [Leishmania enriettii]
MHGGGGGYVSGVTHVGVHHCARRQKDACAHTQLPSSVSALHFLPSVALPLLHSRCLCLCVLDAVRFGTKRTRQSRVQSLQHKGSTARVSTSFSDPQQAAMSCVATSDHPAVALQPAMRQRTIIFCFPDSGSVSSTSAAEAAEVEDDDAVGSIRVVLHLSIRYFVDYMLLFVTEAQTCAPGVIIRCDAPAVGPGAFMYDGETPSLDFAVLLGLRDHPLTNLLASTIARRICRYGESRSLLMGLSVVQTAKKLSSSHAKKLFLDYVASNLLELAREEQSALK